MSTYWQLPMLDFKAQVTYLRNKQGQMMQYAAAAYGIYCSNVGHPKNNLAEQRHHSDENYQWLSSMTAVYLWHQCIYDACIHVNGNHFKHIKCNRTKWWCEQIFNTGHLHFWHQFLKFASQELCCKSSLQQMDNKWKELQRYLMLIRCAVVTTI